MNKVRLGELLVRAGIVSEADLIRVLEQQAQDHRRLGILLVEAGLVTETQVTQLLSQQLSVPWISLYHVDFSRQLLNLVPSELVERYCVVPVLVRRVRGHGDVLHVAMEDPSDEEALEAVARASGLHTRPMIAPPSDIRAAIRAYYGFGDESDPPEEAVEAAVPADPVANVPRDEPLARPPSAPIQQPKLVGTPASGSESASASESQPEPSQDGSGSERTPEMALPSREVSMPPPRHPRAARMVTLTMLDGTQINLPARAPREAVSKAPPQEPQLTARDLVEALKAVSAGADAGEILGEEVRWERSFAALLSLLLRKQIIADWEFVQEFAKIHGNEDR